MILLVVTIILLLAYIFLFAFYTNAWKKVPVFIPVLKTRPAVFITVIVPARNEAGNIGHLLTAMALQDYPAENFEVIVANDHSSDNTVATLSEFPQVRLITLSGNEAGKKTAIAKGIDNAKGELVVTTDADCIPGKHWLSAIAEFYGATNAAFIAAPVKYTTPNSLLSIFQTIDFISLQGITAAGVEARFHNMCNGANLAYTKAGFREVNGFEGIDNIASGDDLLLMHKISTRYPDRVHYLKSEDVIVSTTPPQTWKEFYSQRIRWASKTMHYKDYRIFFALLLVLLINLLFPVLLVSGFTNIFYWKICIVYLLVKTLSEFIFIYPVAKFFRQQHLLKWFFLLQPLHIFYTITIGVFSQFGTYEWKGRKTK
jgi:poly-beta-1,6-N-acetyl-D-glucosamine synthase